MVHLEGIRPKPIEDTFFLDEETADVHFLIDFEDEVNSIPAHKYVMAGESSVFRSMFFGPLKETGDVRIVNASSAAFTEFMRFIYANQMNLSLEIIAEVMNLANQYQVADCMVVCEKFLEHHLPNDDIFMGFELAVFFNRAALKAKLEQKVGDQLDIVIKSDRFLNCSRDTLQNVLEMKFLLCDAKVLFDGCMKWAVKACERNKNASTIENQRKQLGDCLYMIPFQAMQPEQVSACVNQYEGLFDQKEMVDLINIATSKVSVKLNKFNYKRNLSALWDVNPSYWTTCYWMLDEETRYWIQKTEVVSIGATNKNRLLGGFKVLEIWHNQKKRTNVGVLSRCVLSGTISVVEKIENEEDETLLKQTTTIECSAYGSGSTQYFKLFETVLIEKDKEYDIRVSFDSTWSDGTFFLVVPSPGVCNPNGIFHSLLFCDIPEN